eukprot:m51a1_g12744 hypothetical protein (706) ;mRNA; r:747-3350
MLLALINGRDCSHNGFAVEDVAINAEMQYTSFLDMGEHLPLAGRSEELEQIRYVVDKHVSWKSARLTGGPRAGGGGDFVLAKDDEKGAKECRFPMVADAPGSGKTTLMTRGVASVLREHFAPHYTGRGFLFDLSHDNSNCQEMFCQSRTPEAADHGLALRILHQSLNGRGGTFPVFSSSVLAEEEKYSCRLTLAEVLSLVINPTGMKEKQPPFVVQVHFSEAQVIVKQKESRDFLGHFLRAVFAFNESGDCPYLIFASFDGLNDKEIRRALETSGLGIVSVNMSSLSHEDYVSIVQNLFKQAKAPGSGIKLHPGLLSPGQWTPTADVARALSQFYSNVRLFAVFLWHVGSDSGGSSQFVWQKLLYNLAVPQPKVSRLESWLDRTGATIRSSFDTYTAGVLCLPLLARLDVLLTVLFERVVDLADEIRGTAAPPITWGEFAVSGHIKVTPRSTVVLPSIVWWMVLESLKRDSDADSWLRYIHFDDELTAEVSFRLTERTDLAMLIARVISAYHSSNRGSTFKLSDLNSKFTGALAGMPLRFPDWVYKNPVNFAPTCATGQFATQPRVFLAEEGTSVVLGCGNDPFGDSAMSFKAQDSDSSVLVVVQSKKRKGKSLKDVSGVHAERAKVAEALAQRHVLRPFFFIYVSDEKGSWFEPDVAACDLEDVYGRAQTWVSGLILAYYRCVEDLIQLPLPGSSSRATTAGST